MALQDLTPQLRTRLSRMERAVGWFVMLAVFLLAFGFAYYVYTTAERKGWFQRKAPYFAFTANANGLKVGDGVKLMGFDVGQITRIEAMPAHQFTYNVYIEFILREPYYGFMWSEGSHVRVTAADFLGKRELEVTKGTNGYPTYTFYPLQTNTSVADIPNLTELRKWQLAQDLFDRSGTNLLTGPEGIPYRATTWLTNVSLKLVTNAGYTALDVMDAATERHKMTGKWNDDLARYVAWTDKSKPYWLQADESPPLTERLETVINQIQQALPNVLALTNQLTVVLSNSAQLTSNLNLVAMSAQPAVSNLALATRHLDQPGALGEWLLPTNLNRQLEGTLTNANVSLATVNTNLTSLAENLNRSLDNLAAITSNLNHQVELNTNLLSSISGAVIHADQFVQGLKNFWLFRHLFKNKETNAPPPAPVRPLRSPKAKDQ